MIGPAAMNGPRPGMASAPMPTSQPSVPPTTAPVPAPAAAPSGALVCFSCANSFVLVTSGNSTETSFERKPA